MYFIYQVFKPKVIDISIKSQENISFILHFIIIFYVYVRIKLYTVIKLAVSTCMGKSRCHDEDTELKRDIKNDSAFFL